MRTFKKARQISQKLHKMGFSVEGKNNKVTVSLNRKVNKSEVENALDFKTSNLVLAQRSNAIMIVVVK